MPASTIAIVAGSWLLLLLAACVYWLRGRKDGSDDGAAGVDGGGE